jgi:hypothetical protein
MDRNDNTIFNRMSARERDAKLRKLATFEGFGDPMEMISSALFDAVSRGICVVCDATVPEIEPDQRCGYCSNCREGFVVAAPVLARII